MFFYKNGGTNSVWVQGSGTNSNLIWKAKMQPAKMCYNFLTKFRTFGYSDADIEKWTFTTFACSGAKFKFCNLGQFNEIPTLS